MPMTTTMIECGTMAAIGGSGVAVAAIGGRGGDDIDGW